MNLFKKTKSSKESSRVVSQKIEIESSCFCQNDSISYKIIENYHSILDRKQQLISSWKILNRNEKVSFTRGTQHRKGTDALVIRLDSICLINPWYHYINVNKHLRTIVRQNQYVKVFEVVLLESDCLTHSHQYQLAIIECPCLEKLKSYCTYCQLVLTATESSEQQIDTSSLSLHSHADENRVQNETKSESLERSLDSLPLNEICRFSHLSQKSITILHHGDSDNESFQSSDVFTNKNLTDLKNEATQTKLFAILLPQSPLTQMKPANIETRTLTSITRSCQVNTLSYLIKTNDIEDDDQQLDRSLTTSFLRSDSQLLEESAKEIQTRTVDNCEHDEYRQNVPVIQFEETPKATLIRETALTSVPLKCINAFDTVDLDGPDAFISPLQLSDHSISFHRRQENQNRALNTNHHFSRLTNKYYRFISRKKRQTRNKKRIHAFLQRLHRRRKPNTVLSLSSPTLNEIHPSNPIISSFERPQPSIVDLHLNYSNSPRQYKLHDHTIITRASKSSRIHEQLQTILNHPEKHLDDLLDYQLTLTSNENCQSVCVLIDDHKQSEQTRSLFLHYIYTTLSDTLKKILHTESLQLTCMNLAFFNNSLCDIITMKRVRLIDTGRKIFLSPSCEIPLKTSKDIDKTINYLSTKMSFAHQILIINFHHQQTETSSSFFFLQLAPICSIRSTGLFTNLNSTTYSVLNLLRYYNENLIKRYLFNDCLLNRLLKNYFFSSQQTMIVMTVRKQEKKKQRNQCLVSNEK